MNRVASIHDVAREAGVSIATVSRVINQRSRVADETRRRVLKTMQRLKYQPNMQARALSLQRTDTLGLILPDLYGDYYGELMRGVDERCRRAGMHMMVTRAASMQDEQYLVQRFLLEGRVDGLILFIAEVSDRILDELTDLKKPLVVLDQDVGPRHLDNLLVDNYTGSFDATRHLIDAHGLENLVFLGGPENNIDTQDRAKGFRDALIAAGHTPSDDQFLFHQYDYDAGYRAALTDLRSLPSGKSGVIAANDDLARGAIDALIQSGLRVPEDIAVIGHDDSHLARRSRPTLTSVHIPLREIGQRAVEIILDRISGELTQPTKTIFKGHLATRASCGCKETMP